MRRRSLTLIALFAISVAVPASAQVVTTSASFAEDQFAKTPSPAPPQAKPEAVVARLMSFDSNHDGLVTRDELPERMQTLLMRADTSKDQSLDADEVLRLAQRPPVVVTAQRGFEPGHYGFGEDFGLDTRLHIEGAIEDLRLAARKRDEALSIGRRFVEEVNAQAKADLFKAAAPLLTAEQLAALEMIVDRPIGQTAVSEELALPQGANQQQIEEAVRALVERLSTAQQRANLARLVTKYPLGPDDQKTLQAAVQRFQAHDQLNDDDRSVLLARLHTVLSDQEREDLRAALERRPIVKQNGLTGKTVSVSQNGQKIQVAF